MRRTNRGRNNRGGRRRPGIWRFGELVGAAGEGERLKVAAHPPSPPSRPCLPYLNVRLRVEHVVDGVVNAAEGQRVGVVVASLPTKKGANTKGGVEGGCGRCLHAGIQAGTDGANLLDFQRNQL